MQYPRRRPIASSMPSSIRGLCWRWVFRHRGGTRFQRRLQRSPWCGKPPCWPCSFRTWSFVSAVIHKGRSRLRHATLPCMNAACQLLRVRSCSAFREI
jgi:hypothetical protein